MLHALAGDTMARQLLDNELWKIVASHLPPPKPRRRRHPGRRSLEPQRVFMGILLVLRTGMAWEDLPPELGVGSGMTCWRYLRDWHKAGVFRQVFEDLLNRLNAQGKIDWSRSMIDSASVRAILGGKRPAPTRRTG